MVVSSTKQNRGRKVEADKTSAEEMQVPTENGVNQSHPKKAAKRSQSSPTSSSKKLTKSSTKSTNSSIKSTKGKRILRSADSPRVLRSRSQGKGKDPEPSIKVQEQSVGASGGNKGKRKKKKKQMKDGVVDEFSKTRKHLRYVLQRMAYEQNLIDAYAGEGWKGQSAEKLRPEKELERARSEILRCKLKIRDLFQRIDLSLVEGALPDSLFDSEGEIDSEDIFCSKCGLKDVTLENDIILCDGACERAFHQFCVQPPLLKEDIPTDDDGWLCPACDCKDDCLDFLNDAQGTNLSILDSWEKVYPEAAAAAAGKALENNLELPSDDSEDDDYRPDGLETEEDIEGGESSSDESDLYSASEDNGVVPPNEKNLQLPSDDSEDDDFDPDAADVDEEVKQESSDSDFTSASEDLNLVVDTSGSANGSLTSNKVGRVKKPSLNDELSSLLVAAKKEGEGALISARREVERLDYQKLYEEQYGNVPTDSSDEDFGDDDVPKRRKKNNADVEKILTKRANKKLDTGGPSDSPSKSKKNDDESEKTPKKRAHKKQDTGGPSDSPSKSKNNADIERTIKRGAHKKLDNGGTTDSPSKSNKAPSEPGSNSASAKSSASRKLGEAASQALFISFKENQNPDRDTREKLASELGITEKQVYKWFANSRWSFRHIPSFASKLSNIPTKETPAQINQPEARPHNLAEDVKGADVAPPNEQNLQLPSDDSEDDDFDPDAADVDEDEDVKQDSSDSDFSSASEDLNLIVDTSGSPNKSMTSKKVGRVKKPSLNDELSSLLEGDNSKGEGALISASREVERLDYQKLYEEQNGNVPTDSSDDEFGAAEAPKRRKKNNADVEKIPKNRAYKKLDTGGPSDSPSNSKNNAESEKTPKKRAHKKLDTEGTTDSPSKSKKKNDNIEKTPKNGAHKKLDTGGTADSPSKSNKAPSEPGSNSASAKSSASRKLGEAATQGLLISFKENQNPDRATREKLASELGITEKQVSKWFMNSRWSFRHTPSFASKLANIPTKGTPARIDQAESSPLNSAEDVKATNVSPGDSKKDTTSSQKKVGKRGKTKGKKSAKSSAKK